MSNITRRDLLKYCAMTGGVIGLSAGMLERKNEPALRIGGKGKTASKIYQQMLDEGLRLSGKTSTNKTKT